MLQKDEPGWSKIARVSCILPFSPAEARTLHFITPGRPMENGYVESSQGKFREECLNEHWFITLDDPHETIES